VEEDHQEVLRDLPTPQLQPGPGFLHLLLLSNLLVQPECMPRTQASSAVRWKGGPCASVLLHLLGGGGRKGLLKA